MAKQPRYADEQIGGIDRPAGMAGDQLIAQRPVLILHPQKQTDKGRMQDRQEREHLQKDNIQRIHTLIIGADPQLE